MSKNKKSKNQIELFDLVEDKKKYLAFEITEDKKNLLKQFDKKFRKIQNFSKK